MLPFQENCVTTMPPQLLHELRDLIGKLGNGESPLRVWMNRKYIVFDEENRSFCKTEDYMKKVRLAS